MANQRALRLIELRLHPVLLGSKGDDLKRPLHKGWRTAAYTADDVKTWPARNNIGIRCGLQRDGRALITFDFDEEAERIFPAWRWGVERRIPWQLAIVASGRGYHVYFFTEDEPRGRTLAGRYSEENGRKRLHKFIETLGQGRQVVAAGGRHPNGQRYRFLSEARYADIATLTVAQYQSLVALSRTFDQRPARQSIKPKQKPARPPGVQNCLDYARRFIRAEERVEANGDIPFPGTWRPAHYRRRPGLVFVQ